MTRGRDGGFTLPELLVTVTLMAIVSAALIGSVVAANRGLGAADATMRDMAATRIAVERVGHLLRGAVAPSGRLGADESALLVAEPDRVVVHTATGLDPGANPLRVELVVEAGDLVERIWEPQPALLAELPAGGLPTYPAEPARQRVVVRDVQQPAVFTYWTHTDDGTPSSRCGRILPDPADADLRLVDSISYRLVVQEPTGYDSAASDLQGWARFASDAELGISGGPGSAGCLADGGFSYGDPYGSAP